MKILEEAIGGQNGESSIAKSMKPKPKVSNTGLKGKQVLFITYTY